ncbi:stress response protein NST1-like [Neltuma alba]|uniref:stress response protein NST1-like n=1 Tax=Neltuma alba TaxID=207710 RepID=UPI0010A2CF38|nr:stress response protein NST1-like [Prosopis alba]
MEKITREVVAGSGDEELNENDTSKGDDEKDEDEEEHDLHDKEGGHDYMVEEVEDEGDCDGRGGDDDDDEDEDDHDDKEGGHDYVVEEAEDDDKEVEDSYDEGEEGTHAKTATPTNIPLLLDYEWESNDSGEEAGLEKSTELRRSTRVKSFTIKSPWMEFKVLNLACKAMIEDMKVELGPGKRHIFNVDFMVSLALVGQHWFCVAIQPSTLDFHVLDSISDHFEAKDMKKKKKVVIKDPVEIAVDECEGLWVALHDVTEKMGTWCDP